MHQGKLRVQKHTRLIVTFCATGAVVRFNQITRPISSPSHELSEFLELLISLL